MKLVEKRVLIYYIFRKRGGGASVPPALKIITSSC